MLISGEDGCQTTRKPEEKIDNVCQGKFWLEQSLLTMKLEQLPKFFSRQNPTQICLAPSVSLWLVYHTASCLASGLAIRWVGTSLDGSNGYRSYPSSLWHQAKVILFIIDANRWYTADTLSWEEEGKVAPTELLKCPLVWPAPLPSLIILKTKNWVNRGWSGFPVQWEWIKPPIMIGHFQAMPCDMFA